MRTFSFDIILESPDVFEGDRLDEWAERLFELFKGDITPAVIAGVPQLGCDIEAESLEGAIRRVLDVLRVERLPVKRLEMDPEEMEALQAA